MCIRLKRVVIVGFWIVIDMLLENFKVRVFVREGDDAYTLNLSWDGLKIATFDDSNVVNLRKFHPHVEESDRQKWAGDYKTLAQKVLESRGEYTTMVANIPEGASPEARNFILTTSFLTSYCGSQREAGK